MISPHPSAPACTQLKLLLRFVRAALHFQHAEEDHPVAYNVGMALIVAGSARGGPAAGAGGAVTLGGPVLEFAPATEVAIGTVGAGVAVGGALVLTTGGGGGGGGGASLLSLRPVRGAARRFRSIRPRGGPR
jgi:hypothetical protein